MCRAPNAGSHCSRAVTAPFPFLICVTLPRGVVMVSKAMLFALDPPVLHPQAAAPVIPDAQDLKAVREHFQYIRRTRDRSGHKAWSDHVAYIHGDGVLGKDAYYKRIAGSLSGRTGLSACFRVPAYARKLRTGPDVPPCSFVQLLVEQGAVCDISSVHG